MRPVCFPPRSRRTSYWGCLFLLLFIPLWTGCSLFSPPPDERGPLTTKEFLSQDRIPR